MGIIHARPFNDPRNSILVDNNDPTARDKSHAGIPGNHSEQRCCDDKAPSRLPQGTGWYVDGRGQRIVKIIEFWGRPENRAGAKDGWWNAETPPGLFVEMAPTGVLMCNGCFGSEWDQFLDDLSTTFDQLIPIIGGVSMAISYIPVFGTAVSFLLTASVSLAKGASVDAAFLDGIGTALPGQPASGMAYNAARALVRGDRIDQLAIASLPVDESVKQVIFAAVEIAVAIAHGQEISNIALEQIYARLPEDGKKAIDIARKVVAGENVGDLVVTEAMRATADAARTQGEGALNKYLAQAGFQSSLDTLEPALENALKAGLIAGNSERHQFIGTFDFSEKNVQGNDALAAKGQAIIASGANLRGRLLSTIRAGSSFTFTREALDAVSGTMQMRTDVHEISDGWRRGFDVAIGACDGTSLDGPGQQKIKLSLGDTHAKQGFDVGQFLQHQRTLGGFGSVMHSDRIDALDAPFAVAVREGTVAFDQSATPLVDNTVVVSAALQEAFAASAHTRLSTEENGLNLFRHMKFK